MPFPSGVTPVIRPSVLRDNVRTDEEGALPSKSKLIETGSGLGTVRLRDRTWIVPSYNPCTAFGGSEYESWIEYSVFGSRVEGSDVSSETYRPTSGVMKIEASVTTLE